VALFSPFASSHPDGLEKVAADKGFLEEGKGPSYEIIPDYKLPGVENERVATILSGVIGVALVAGLGFGIAFALKAFSRHGTAGASSPPERG
jgi:cobalt/nickel transport protein